jgi:hypothetical protein
MSTRSGLDSTIPLSVIATILGYQIYDFFQAPNMVGDICGVRGAEPGGLTADER